MPNGRKHRIDVIVLVVLVIAVACLGNMSQTAVGAMFFRMSPDLGVDIKLGQWATTAYMLVIGISVPPVSFLMKRYPVKQILVCSTLLLLVGGAIDAVATSFPIFLLGRTLQATSTGFTMSMVSSVVTMSFPQGKRARAMGFTGLAMGFAPNIGPTIGGIVVSCATWRVFFAALAIMSLICFATTMLFVERKEPLLRDCSLDMASFVLSSVGFSGILLGFSNASSSSLTSPFVWLPLAMGIVSFSAFVLRQRRIANPLISMRIFEQSEYATAFWVLNCTHASFLGIALILPLFVEEAWGGTSLEAGMALLPGTITVLTITPLSGFVTDRIGIRPVARFGAIMLCLGASCMTLATSATPFWTILLFQGFRSIGLSCLISPFLAWGLSALPRELVSDGSSFTAAVRQAGGAMATAAMVFLVTLGSGTLGSIVLGYQMAFGLSALFSLAAAILIFTRVR